MSKEPCLLCNGKGTIPVLDTKDDGDGREIAIGFREAPCPFCDVSDAIREMVETEES